MATKGHCAFCFEVLAANFEHRQALTLNEVDALWTRYESSRAEGGVDNEDDGDDEEHEDGPDNDDLPRPAAISRLLNKSSASSSSSSLPSNPSSSVTASGATTPASSISTSASSRTSLAASGKSKNKTESFPLFVTWNTVSRGGHKSLRGCIGTFEAQPLETGLRSYALTSALEDYRFSPIPASSLSSLSAHVTLLTNFSQPVKDPLDWTIGTHGIRISFVLHGKRYGSTYLPDVAQEQGWTKEEAIVSLMRKAGWSGSSRDWQKAWTAGSGQLIRYEGKQIGLHYPEWKEWKEWVAQQGIKSKALN